jgi:hypothetical protein
MPIRKRKRVVEKELWIPCYCSLCNGRKRTPGTVKKHTALAASLLDEAENIYNLPNASTVNTGRGIPQQEEGSVHVVAFQQPLPITREPPPSGVSDQALELIEAYDNFFDICCPAAKTNLESGSSQNLEYGTANKMTAATLIVMHLDWMDSFNVSENSAEHQWNTLRSTLSHNDADAVGKFKMIKQFVKDYRLATAKKIHMCPCTETIYYDLKDARLCRKFPHIKNTGQDHCEKCLKSRYVLMAGVLKPRKVFWYLPYRYDSSQLMHYYYTNYALLCELNIFWVCIIFHHLCNNNALFMQELAS